jgi:tellurite resistance protein TerC
VVPVTHEFRNGHFTFREHGKLFATPLLVTLVFIEVSDVIFAVDSIPAILAITHDPFIVYTSNIFAILGLRALFFALSGFMAMFHYLSYGLSAILVFIGTKMLLVDLVHIPIWASLLTIVVILLIAVFFSVRRERRLAALRLQAEPPEEEQ